MMNRRRKGIYDGVNPMTGVTIPKGKKHGRKRLAYTLEEVEKHLELFSGKKPIVILTEDGAYTPEIAQSVVRATIGVAAFAGLRQGEIRGQWWEDDDGDILNIRRSVWRTHLKDETKTHEDDEDPGVVPIIKPLRGSCSMRSNRRMLLAGCSRIRLAVHWTWTILPTVSSSPFLRMNGLEWKGWHAYSSRPVNESEKTRCAGHCEPSDPQARRRENDAAVLHQDRARRCHRRHEAA